MDINELTYLINGAIFDVNRELGAGFLEKVLELKAVDSLQKIHEAQLLNYLKATVKIHSLATDTHGHTRTF